MNYILDLEYVKEKTNEKQRDCLRCTPIFHDAIKCGTNGSQYTVHDHPLLAGKWIRDTVVEHDIDKETKEYIARLCESHSGQWISNKRSSTVLPKPENDEQFLVHLCDYLSSRSNIDMTYSDEVCNVYKDMFYFLMVIDEDNNDWSYQVVDKDNNIYAQYYDREYGINEVVEKIDKVINEVINEMAKEKILEVKKYGKYKNNRKSKHDKHSKKGGKVSQSK